MASLIPHEIELKLEVDAEDVAELKTRLLPRLGQGGETAHLASVYYDTPDHDLRAEGVSLRVRLANGRIVQTVKMASGTTVGLFDRHEWERPLPTREPDLVAFGKTPAAGGLDIALDALRPVFETQIDRTIWIVETARSTIEIALDDGRVVVGTEAEAFAELELELKRGEARDLFALVEQLKAVGSLRPGVRVKSERGYLLLAGKAPRAYKAEPVSLNKRMTTAEAFQVVIHGCLRQLGLNAPLVVASRTPESLHQARVALRRLRSALSLFKPLVADDRFETLKTRLQAVSSALGDARNLDVYLDRAARLEEEHDEGVSGAPAFLERMAARRAAAYDRVVACLRAPAFRGLLLDLLEWVECGAWLTDADPLWTAARDQHVRTFAAGVLQRQRRRVRRKGRNLATLDPQARHRVRIEAKKLRYAAEFFASLARGHEARRRHAAFVAALEDLQGYLGDLNDIRTAHDFALNIATAPESEGQGADTVFAAAHVSGRQDAQVDNLLASAADAHRHFGRRKRFWSSWSA